MDRQLVKLLDSPIEADRRKAIKAIAQSNDIEYIPYLAALYKTEASAEIKDLAAKAARYLKRQNTEGEWGGTGINEAPVEKSKLEPVAVSAANEKRAKDMLDRALQISMAGQEGEARELVIKAYRANPNIRFDSYQSGMVASIMGGSPQDVFDQLDEDVVVTKTKRKNSEGKSPEVGWGRALADLLIYGTVVAVTVIITLLIGIQVARPYILEAAQNEARYSELSADNIATTVQLAEALIGAGTGVSIAYGVFSGLASVFGMLIAALFIHIAAKMILGGVGSMSRLIHKLVPAYTVFTIISMVFSAVAIVFIIQDLPNMAEQATTFTQTDADTFTMNIQATLGPAVQLIQAIGSILSLVFWVIIVGRIASAYEFSWLRGCLAQFIGGILMCIAACGCIFAFSSIFAGAVGSLLPVMTQMPR